MGVNCSICGSNHEEEDQKENLESKVFSRSQFESEQQEKTKKQPNTFHSNLNQGTIAETDKEEISYRGKTSHKMKDGFGIIKWKSGAEFKGIFRDNYPNGYGIFSEEGTTTSGEFVNDQSHGYGLFQSKLSNYEGQWAHNKMEGYGIDLWKDGAVYKGQYRNGLKCGIGKYTFANQDIYEGEWENNVMKGYGIYYSVNGNMFYGEWFNDMKNGYGEYLWSNGEKYIGYYKDNIQEGFFIRFEFPEKISIGFKVNGKQEGYGKLFVSETKCRYGYWKNDKRTKWIDNDQEAFDDWNKKKLYFKFFKYSYSDLLTYVNQSYL